MLAAASPVCAQLPTFRWIDFHAPEEQTTVDWVQRSLATPKWSSIREIGVLYDAALVLTTERANSEAMPAADTFTLWSVSLTTHDVYVLLHGANPRLAGWFNFTGNAGEPADLGLFYDNCQDCAAETFFTAFHYDLTLHAWLGRWMRGELAIPLWTAKAPDGVDLTQLYAVMAEPSGRNYLVTWKHFEYGKLKDPEDFLYRYDLDPDRDLERTMLVYGKQAEELQKKLCRGQDALPGLSRGQDAPLCQIIAKPLPERHPTVTPPANNRGLSAPPAAPRRR